MTTGLLLRGEELMGDSYEALARYLDENLAEVDMESFGAENIHSLLNMYCEGAQGEKFASMSDSFVSKLDLIASGQQGSFRSMESSSLCASEPLFSPEKQPKLQATSTFSTDSLDLDKDITLTCQPVKDNYTIAFQTSLLQDVTGPTQVAEEGLCRISSFPCPDDIPIPQSTWSKLKEEMTRGQTVPIYNSCRSKREQSMQTSLKSLARTSRRTPIYVCYPNYSLPDLSFLKTNRKQCGDFDLLLLPHQLLPDRGLQVPSEVNRRPFSCNDVDMLKKKGASHIRDWDSLSLLLPPELRHVIGKEQPGTTSTSSGYKGSSTILSESALHEQCPDAPQHPAAPPGERTATASRAVRQPQQMRRRTRLRERDVSLENLAEQVGAEEDLLSRSQSSPNLNAIGEECVGRRAGVCRLCQAPAAREQLLDHYGRLVDNVSRSVRDLLSLMLCCTNQTSLLLERLCPPLVALLSDGLQPTVRSIFGPLPNSVWRLIEATSQLGSSTQTLGDLVLKLNSEEQLMDGPLKVNAFLLGLLNMRALRSWLAYLRTRESAIQKHYAPEAFLYQAGIGARGFFDRLLRDLEPVCHLTFHLDLLYEYRQLHRSLLVMEEQCVRPKHLASPTKASRQRKTDAECFSGNVARLKQTFSQDRPQSPKLRRKGNRPHSCVEAALVSSGSGSECTRRWSVLQSEVGSKILQALDRIMDPLRKQDDPPTPTWDKERRADYKFRILQERWEILSGNPSCPSRGSKSRIPRPISLPSPVKSKSSVKPPVPLKNSVNPDKSPIHPRCFPKPILLNSPMTRSGSLQDKAWQMAVGSPLEDGKLKRRSASAGRQNDGGSSMEPLKERWVGFPVAVAEPPFRFRRLRTLCHHAAKDSGHLSFKSGQELILIIEVDDKWLLCRKKNQKGLVPRNAVILIDS